MAATSSNSRNAATFNPGPSRRKSSSSIRPRPGSCIKSSLTPARKSCSPSPSTRAKRNSRRSGMRTGCATSTAPRSASPARPRAGADIVGVNCLRNPLLLLPLAREMRQAVSGFVACQPTAYSTPPGIPDFTATKEFPYETETLVLSRKVMGAFAAEAHAAGVNYIGSCCGSMPVHVREMARALGRDLSGRGRRARHLRFDPRRGLSGLRYGRWLGRPGGLDVVARRVQGHRTGDGAAGPRGAALRDERNDSRKDEDEQG